jgi:hypothetical protein
MRRRKKVEIPLEILEQFHVIFRFSGCTESERAMMILHLFIYNYRAPCVLRAYFIGQSFFSFRSRTHIPFEETSQMILALGEKTVVMNQLSVDNKSICNNIYTRARRDEKWHSMPFVNSQ